MEPSVCLSPAGKHRHGSLCSRDTRRLTTGISSEKCVVRRFSRANVYLPKTRQYSIAYKQAVRTRALEICIGASINLRLITSLELI